MFKGVATFVMSLAMVSSGVVSLAEESEPTQIFVQNTVLEYVYNTPGQEQEPYEVEVLVSGPASGAVRVSFLDTIEPDDTRRTLPAGSAPSSLTNAIELSPMDLNYIPNGKTQSFLLSFRLRENVVSRAYFGKLRISFAPGSGGSDVGSSIGVSKDLFVMPHGWVDDNLSEDRTPSTIVKSSIDSSVTTSFLDELIPDLPGLVNGGPVKANVRLENKGVYPNSTFVEWKFFDGETMLAQRQIPDEFMLGGSFLNAEFVVVYTEESIDRTFDVLPMFRLLRQEVLVQSELSGLDYPPELQVSYFVIAPWKELASFIALAIFSGFVLRRLVLKRKRLRVAPKTQAESNELPTRDGRAET